ncbi:MAG: DNA polymerase/3'-5' exonuclease PolX, partial [Candidatus Liptonbacteria bacterium]
IKYHEELKKSTPVDLSELSRVQGLGPKSIKVLYEKLGIKNLSQLEYAARKGRIQKLAGFGKKKEESILKGLAFAETAGDSFILGYVTPLIRSLEERLRGLKGVEHAVAAGSSRRRKEVVHDIDILVVAEEPRAVTEYVSKMPEVVQVLGRGDTRTSVRLRTGIQLDVRVVEPQSYGAALNYFTGSKNHNVALREIAIKKGYKLNEYGLFKGEKRIAGKSEEEIYKLLGLKWMEPELRENTGELEAAQKGTLPKLLEYDALKGDLQVQTDWSDGSDSILTMAKAAKARGLEYIAITDHTKRLTIANGLDEKRIVKQWAEIDRVNKSFGGTFKVLKGSECDILKDGTLDLPDKILEKLDIVGVSVHSFFNLPEKEQTARIVRAMENKNADIIFHPTGRVINHRAPYSVDMGVLIREARRTGTILEIDAYPERLDIKDEYIRKCVEAGVLMTIDSDAHSSAHFQFLEFGIAEARRGWAEKDDIANAWPLQKFLKSLKAWYSTPIQS